MSRWSGLAIVGAALIAMGLSVPARATDLIIESWRNDDLAIWQDKIIPVFEAKHPDIKVTFSPYAPREYDAALNVKLKAGTAGDLITCRPFDLSLRLFNDGQLAPLNDLPGIDNFTKLAKAAWTTDDGKTTFCVPMAAVIHGFFYNKAIFKKLNLEPPKTMDEFFAVLDKVKKDGEYTPLVLGTADQWDSAYMGYQNIGPTYWQGEKGRLGLLDGSQKLTDPQFVEPFKVLARWGQYMGDGYSARTYADSQNLFTLGKGAIYPTGSWETATFRSQADFDLGIFPPPRPKAGDQCFINDHPDIGLGVNPASKNAAAARVFLEWLTTPEFAEIYANQLPGFFPLQSAEVKLTDPLAQQFASWRKDCKSSFRSFYQILSRGTPSEDGESWVLTANVINGVTTPEQASERLENDLKGWYAPHKK
jgi:raffinose/stachyose/melibiose transport system substrate-binding protein